MKEFRAFLDGRRYKNWAHKSSSSEYLTVWKPGPASFSRSMDASCLLSTLNSLQGVLKVRGCSSTWLNPRRRGQQVSVESAGVQLAPRLPSRCCLCLEATRWVKTEVHELERIVTLPFIWNRYETWWPFWISCPCGQLNGRGDFCQPPRFPSRGHQT